MLYITSTWLINFITGSLYFLIPFTYFTKTPNLSSLFWEAIEHHVWASLMAQWVENPPAMQETEETQVRSLGQEDSLEKEMATHSSVLAWKIPWTEEPDRLQSTGSKRVGHDWATSLSKSDKKYPRTVSRTQMSAHIRKGSFFLEITGFLWFGRHMPPSTDGRVVGWLGNLGHIHPGGSSCSGEV